ncbi:response regulator [Pedobacter sp. SYP-B3415]|uniref:response regulator n=1 Tax=Pedobacter sp. SYP-B3415 TaxID=2496641 RepID=UPI00101B5D6F|nr:response regulator [Pedobacter sp. SYP-B3415]
MSSKMILVCDDDPGILEMLEFVLSDAGFEVISTVDSLQVMSMASRRQPDLFLIDLWMPVLSGDALIKNIRENADLADVPVIAISASQESAALAQRAGATLFIAKPFDIFQLSEQVSALIADAGSR